MDFQRQTPAVSSVEIVEEWPGHTSILGEVKAVLDDMVNILQDLCDFPVSFNESVDVGTKPNTCERKDVSISTVEIQTHGISTSVTIEVADASTSTIVAKRSQTATTIPLQTDDIGTMTTHPLAVDKATSTKQEAFTAVKIQNHIQPRMDTDKENVQPMTLIQTLTKAPTRRLGLSRYVTKPLNIQREHPVDSVNAFD